MKNLGRVYRKMLGAGKSIVVSWEDSEGRIKTKSIEVSDPLHLMPNSREVVGTKCTAEELGVCTIVMQGESLPEIFNPKTNSHATVTIRMVRLPITQIRRNLGLRAYFIGGHEDTKIMNKWNINPDYSGFSIIRNGREIDSNQTLRVFRRREGSTTAGFRGEISFDGLEDIDALFGVQVNKSRYSLDRALQDMIYSKCRPTFDQYLKDHEKDVASAKARAKKLENEPPISEGIASMAASLLPQRNISEEERERGKLETQKKVETLLTEARITGDRNILEAQEKLNEAKSKGDEREIEEANMDLEFATENKQQMEQNVKDRFAFESPCRKQLGIIGTGEIFDVEHHGDEAWITINPETPFFKRVYERATQNPEQESLLDLLIFSMAWAEHISADNPEKKRFWMDARRDVSVIAYKFCELMPEGA